ncbi:hypothetical protein [Bradyrhizobium sp.]
MAAAMATFTANDTITKAVSAELNIGEILLVAAWSRWCWSRH